MGTEPARLQERLEAALGPAGGIEREARLAARLKQPHVVHTPTEVGTALGTPAYMVPEPVTGYPTMDRCGGLYALGGIARPLRHTPRQVKRTLAPRNSGKSTREVVFPPPTGGRFK